MKKITLGQVRNLLNQLDSEEISMSRMVEILNETNEPTRRLLIEANEMLRSCYSVIERRGVNVNWEAIDVQVKKTLIDQHKVIYPEPKKPADQQTG